MWSVNVHGDGEEVLSNVCDVRFGAINIKFICQTWMKLRYNEVRCFSKEREGKGSNLCKRRHTT
jgi:hypothetical protein